MSKYARAKKKICELFALWRKLQPNGNETAVIYAKLILKSRNVIIFKRKKTFKKNSTHNSNLVLSKPMVSGSRNSRRLKQQHAQQPYNLKLSFWLSPNLTYFRPSRLDIQLLKVEKFLHVQNLKK